MGRQYKLLTAFNIESGDKIWLAKSGVSTVEVSLPQGAWFFGSDTGWVNGASNPHRDILFEINQAIADHLQQAAIDGNNFGASIVFTMNADHTVRCEGFGTGVITVRFTNPDASGSGDTTALYDAMRFSQTDFQFSVAPGAFPTNDGTRVHEGGFYPRLYLVADLEAWLGEQSAGEIIPDEGNIFGINTARRRQYTVGIRVDGKPRDTTTAYTEYHFLQDWWSTAAAFRVIAFYPDTTVTTPYSPTNRWGYLYMTMSKQSHDLVLRPQQGNWHKYWLAEFLAYEYAFS